MFSTRPISSTAFALLLIPLLVHCGDKRSPGDTSVNVLQASVDAINPNIGVGGEEVVISGSGFEPSPLEVYFGDAPAVVTAESPTKIIAIVPASPVVGAVDVRIVATGGDEPKTITFVRAFIYRSATQCALGPVITSVIYPLGKTTASNNDTISIFGENFDPISLEPPILLLGEQRAVVIAVFETSRITASVPNMDDLCTTLTCPMDATVINPSTGCSFVLEDEFIYARGDTDGDGLTDFEEINECYSDPEKRDTDGDTLDDFTECRDMETDPRLKDTDGDARDDNVDAEPLNPDHDGDGSPAPADCNDDDSAVHPGATDYWGNDVDLDCEPDVTRCVNIHSSGTVAELKITSSQWDHIVTDTIYEAKFLQRSWCSNDPTSEPSYQVKQINPKRFQLSSRAKEEFGVCPSPMMTKVCYVGD